MKKWFEDKFEDNKIRSYTKHRINKPVFDSFFRKHSTTNWIIVINIIIFFVIWVAILTLGEDFFNDNILNYIALQPSLFFKGYVWQIFTSMFVHIDSGHLLANMVSLFFIGNFVERLIGRKRFVWVYILSGIFAGLFYASLSTLFGADSGIGEKIFVNPSIFAVGASGAIFALLGILAVLIPYNRVYLIAGPIIAIILLAVARSIFPSSSFMPILDLLVSLYFIFSIISILSFNSRLMKISAPIEMPFWILPIVAIVPLVIIGLFVDLPIGNTAHFGGLIAGLFYANYLKVRYRKKTELIRRYFSRR